MRKSRSFNAVLGRWKMTTGGFRKHAGQLSFAGNDAAALDHAIKKAEELNIKQEQLKAELAKTTEELRDTLKTGNKHNAALIRYARAKFGYNSKTIKDFQATGEG